MKPINEQFNPDIVKQVRKLTQYKQLLSNILPIECQNHVEVANIRNQNLMLITDSPVWTTRLRQLSPQILEFIRNNSLDENKAQVIHHIQISTRYRTDDKATASTGKPLKAPQMSTKTSALLSQSANSISHPQLKNALLKMARHSKDIDQSKK